MTTTEGTGMRMKHRLLRLLGVMSPSGARPLPPRWALSATGKTRWYPEAVNGRQAGGEGPC